MEIWSGLLSLFVPATLLVSVANSGIAAISQGVAAETSDRRSFAIPAGDAISTLKLFAKQSNVELLYSTSDISGIVTNAVSGALTSRRRRSRAPGPSRSQGDLPAQTPQGR
jgi:hypothetical protein